MGEKIGTIVKEVTIMKEQISRNSRRKNGENAGRARVQELWQQSAQAAPTRQVLDRITVEYYGAADPAQSGCGTISSPDPRTLVIQPWDGSLLKAIEKAIQTSDLGINPQNDGTRHPPRLPAADRGAPQGAHQAGHASTARTPRSPSATSAATQSTTSRRRRRRARSPRTTRRRPKRISRTSPTSTSRKLMQW